MTSPNVSRHIRRPSKQPVTLQILILISLCSFFAIFLYALRAEGSSEKNFTTIRREELDEIGNLHERAEGLMEGQNFRGAIDVYSEIILTEPDDDAAYTNMGQAYLVLGDFKRAGDAFENALHINPDNEIAVAALKKISDPDFGIMPISSVMPTPKVLQEQATKPAPLPSTKTSKTPATTPSTAPAAKPSTPPTHKPSLAPEPKPSLTPAPKPSAKPAPKQKTTATPIPAASPSPVGLDFILKSDLSFNQWCQVALKNAGLYNGQINGAIDASLKKAVESFQQKNHLNVDGMVGPSTWAKLKRYLSRDSLANVR